VWTLAQSPYLITDTLQIPEGITLTISKGVTVRADKEIGGMLFMVHGTLLAEGTLDEPVILDGNNSYNDFFSPQNAPNPVSIILRFAHIKNGGNLLSGLLANGMSGGQFRLSDSVITNTTGLTVQDYDIQSFEVLIERNIFHNSGTLRIGGGRISIINNRFSVDSEGLRAQYLENSYINIHVAVWGETPLIKFNSFLGDRDAIIARATSGNIKPNWYSLHNYWGTIISSEIEGKILDYQDDITRPGPIPFAPFLTESHPDTP